MKLMILEDNENDIALLQDAIARCGVTDPITFVRDAQGVIDYMTGKNQFADRAKHPLPDLLLFDLNLPQFSGLELLKWFKAHPEFRIPLLVLTSSENEQQISAAYELSATTYFIKPIAHSQLCALIKRIFDYWSVAMMPPQIGPAS